MLDFLNNPLVVTWAPVIISIVSLLFAINSNYRSEKRLKKAEKMKEADSKWEKNFEMYKEQQHREYSDMQKFLVETQMQISVIPYFNIVLMGDKTKIKDNQLFFEVGLKNIGRETAANISLQPEFPDKLLLGYFKHDNDSEKQYYVCDYLNQYYAAVGEVITFGISTDYNIDEGLRDALRFKIRYDDLIGNEYEQEFMFQFFKYNGQIKYFPDNQSSSPLLVKKTSLNPKGIN